VQQTQERWTNESVRSLAGSEDPVDAVVRKARATVVKAIDRGWSGPPFDPLKLAQLMGIEVIGKEAVRDARTVADVQGRLTIEMNPNRPRARLRYSVAHELAHTLFPDCAKHVRNRAAYHELTADDWQLEALCNIGAAEFLMPTGSFPELRREDLSIGRLLDLRQIYGVSAEAVLIRAVRLSSEPVAMFCTSRIESGAHEGSYRLDYLIASNASPVFLHRGALLPPGTAVSECTAIGFAVQRTEAWGEHRVSLECVGVSPYPGSAWPRVVGLVRIADNATRSAPLGISYVLGDALSMASDEPGIIAHVVNDATPNWGGRGFAQAMRERLPVVQDDFRQWVRLNRPLFKLGESRLCRVSSNFWALSMICQEGYGPSITPRLRYGPLQSCLVRLAEHALAHSASVHMPRIGAGQAGGSWGIIEELIGQEICARGVLVTVYDLPRPGGPASPPTH
jgi:Zn-dependent peptidase ImmA (M78 family)/O-acetyl-ADP-ribose deacetylase (regulator of RNase III)